MLPSAEILFGDSPWIFQQDNDPKHTAKSTKDWFQTKKVNVMNWPAQSPDLNPIENLWSYLDLLVKDRKCNTPEELFEVIEKAWFDISQSYLQGLVDSMPKRIKAVIKNKGYPCKY